MRLDLLFEGWLEDSGIEDPHNEDLGALLRNHIIKQFEGIAKPFVYAPREFPKASSRNSSDRLYVNPDVSREYCVRFMLMNFPHDDCVSFASFPEGTDVYDGLDFNVMQVDDDMVSLQVIHQRCEKAICDDDFTLVKAKAVVDSFAKQARDISSSNLVSVIEFLYSSMVNIAKSSGRKIEMSVGQGENDLINSLKLVLTDHKPARSCGWDHPSLQIWIDGDEDAVKIRTQVLSVNNTSGKCNEDTDEYIIEKGALDVKMRKNYELWFLKFMRAYPTNM